MDDPNPIPLPTRKAIVALAANQPSYVVGKDTYTFVVTGADTGSAYALIDGFVPSGGGPPPHCHGYQETLFVIEGELTVFHDQSRTTLKKDAVIHLPGWTPHALKNFTSSPTRVVCVTSPSGLEDQFAEIGSRVPHRDSPPPALPPAEKERIAKLIPGSSERHNARILPPDMFDYLMDKPQR